MNFQGAHVGVSSYSVKATRPSAPSYVRNTTEHCMAVSARLISDINTFSVVITSDFFVSHPEMETKYGHAGKMQYVQDSRNYLQILSESILAQNPLLFADYIAWVTDTKPVPAAEMIMYLDCMRSVLETKLRSEDFAIIAKFISEAVSLLTGTVQENITALAEPGENSSYYLNNLLNGNLEGAWGLIEGLINNGVSTGQIYENIFIPAQRELGSLWQSGRLTPAMEHFCSHTTKSFMSRIMSRENYRPIRNLRLLSATPEGESHEIGLQMMTDILKLQGWDTFYIGGNTPGKSLLDIIETFRIDLLLISLTMTSHISQVKALIESVRGREGISHVKILVGGRPFDLSPGLWKRLGADGYAGSMEEAVKVVDELFPEMITK